MEAVAGRPGYELWRPNRELPESQATKAIVALILVISAALITLITLGGWERLQSEGMAVISLAWAVLYLVLAAMVLRWSRGVLPVAAALAIILAIFAAVAAPAWFARAKDGLSAPALPEELLGILTLVVIPIQLLLIVVTVVAFNQNWHVEEERPTGGAAR